MNEKKKLSLIRLLKGLLDFITGGLLIAAALLVLWMIFSPLIHSRTEGWSTVSVPVRIGRGDEPQFDVDVNAETKTVERVHTAYVDEAEGLLHIQTQNIFIIIVANAARVVTALGLAYIFNHLRNLVGSAIEGEPFTEANMKHLRGLGYGMLVLSFLSPVVEYIASNEILNRLQATSPALLPGPHFDSHTILTPLLILLLARIWAYGLELEHDKALTI